MAKVSISEAARLTQTSRPTLYKMINSGELNFTSAVKAGKPVKVIDTSELIRVFGDIKGIEAVTAFTVKAEPEFTPLNSADLQHLQHQIQLLEKENEGLKEAVAARDEHIASVRQAMLLLENKKEAAQPIQPSGKWWQFWK
jgi:excisionase family DNA binding protein